MQSTLEFSKIIILPMEIRNFKILLTIDLKNSQLNCNFGTPRICILNLDEEFKHNIESYFNV